jgi:hypothetical protein
LNHREFRNLLREGRNSLFIGLSFLALCLSGAEVLTGLEVPGDKGAAGEFDHLRLEGDVASDGDLPVPGLRARLRLSEFGK